jgi:nucleoside-diphosphate-sugar epimerase
VRVLVTGCLNPVGRAVVSALAKDGHQVRAFGIAPGSDPFPGDARIECYPGWLQVGGSLEPVLSECQALIHCANLDAPGEDKQAHAVKVEKGTLYARYAAEREPVGAFVAVFPVAAGRTWGKVVDEATAHVAGTRRLVPTTVVESEDPEAVVGEVRAAIGRAAPKISV